MNLPFFSLKDDGLPARVPFFIAILCAFLSAAAFPPFGLWPLLFVSLVPMIRAAAKSPTPGSAFRLGFVFGLVQFSLILHWLAYTVHTFGAIPWPAAFGVLGLLATYLALYPAVFFLLLRSCHQRGKKLLFWAPAIWTGLEYIRGHLLTGFPWMQAGHGLAEVPLLIQSADLGGVYLISFAILIVNTALAFPGKAGKDLGIALGIWLCLGIYGHFRIASIESQAEAAPQLGVSILQGCMPPDRKWDPDFQEYTLNRYKDLIFQDTPDKTDLFLWPETAIPFYLFSEEEPTRRILKIIRDSTAHHLIGSPAYTLNPPKDFLLFNASYLVSPSGALLSRYAKTHLVPFGEYVPMKDILPFLEKIVVPSGHFTPGNQPPVLYLKDTGLAPLICFESVFPHIARIAVREGAALFAVQTNDAWFGKNGGPRQHLYFSIFRAVEFRRTVVRSANTGISALILPSGVLGQQSPMDTPFVLHTQAPLLAEQTPYARFGDSFAWLCLFVLVYTFFIFARPYFLRR